MLLLQQAAVPVTMLLSIILLKKRYCTAPRPTACVYHPSLTRLSVRYRLVHYVAVGMILAGIAVSLVPQWSEMQQGAAVWAVMVLLLAAVPSSSAFIKIEVEFAAKRMEVLWGWFIINCWQVGLPARFERAHCTHLFATRFPSPVVRVQFVLGLPLMALMPVDESVPLADVLPHVGQSLQCVFTGHNDVPSDDCGQEGLTCASVWLPPMCLYEGVNSLTSRNACTQTSCTSCSTPRW